MILRRARFVVVVVAVAGAELALAACGGGGGGSKATPSSTAANGSSAKSSATKAFVDIQTCDNAGGTGTSTGTIDNEGSSATAYTITIGFFAGKHKVGVGEGTTATVPPGGSADWTVTVSGLAGGDLVCHTLDIATGAGGSSGTTVTTAVPDAEFPCDLVAVQAVSAVVGSPVEPGDAATNHVDENGVTYTARECSWGATGSVDEVRLQVSRTQDNGGKDPGCPSYPGSSTPVDGVGTSAVWSWTDTGTSSTVGTLRVCSAKGLIDVTVSGSTSGDAHLSAARAIADAALASL